MNLKSRILALAIFALAPAVAWGAAGDGLAGTHHDFSGGTATTGGEAFTTGLCTFCHTPHKALSTLLLWNHAASTNALFSWDENYTTGGTGFPGITTATYTGPTTKCLSCHDGSVAVGDIAWFGEGKPTTILVGGEEMTTHYHGPTDPMNVGSGGKMKGNHPVAMPYPFGGSGSTYNGVTTGAAVVTSEFVGDPTVNNIRMFKQVAGVITAGTLAGSTGIECSSCHDPHNKSAKADLFLRAQLGGNSNVAGGLGYICLACHIK